MSDRRRRAEAVDAVLGGTPIIISTRMRVENGYTTTQGHNYASTVEVSYTAAEEDLEDANKLALEQVRLQLEQARAEGTRERNARNKADGR